MKNESFSKQTVSTSTYVAKEDFEKMFSPGPVQTKGLVNLMISYPITGFQFRNILRGVLVLLPRTAVCVQLQ